MEISTEDVEYHTKTVKRIERLEKEKERKERETKDLDESMNDGSSSANIGVLNADHIEETNELSSFDEDYNGNQSRKKNPSEIILKVPRNIMHKTAMTHARFGNSARNQTMTLGGY